MKRAAGHPRCAALVLCGGESRRMGTAKSRLPFRGDTLLGALLRTLQPLAAPLVAAAARGTPLPPLPAEVRVALDSRPRAGPLEGMRAGFTLLAEEFPPETPVYVTGCDAPQLQPGWVRRLAFLAEGYEAAVPCEGERVHPLAAIYRLSVLPALEALLTAEVLRAGALAERVHARRVPVAELRCADPHLVTLRNLNRPEDYRTLVLEVG